MKLIRLRLEQFRQHRDTTVEFRDGMTAIVGANGSGKSTILEGVTFALFGEQRHTKDSIKFHWAAAKDRYRVELTFEFGGKVYVVERGEKGAELRADGNVVAEGLREVKGACERLLKLTRDQFINSFCAEQKSLEFLKFKDRSTRQNEVARMLGLDRLKEAAEASKIEARRCRDKAALLEEELGNQSQLEAAAQEAEARVKAETERREAAAKERRDAESKIASAKKRGEEAARWVDLQAQLQEIRNQGVANQTTRDALGPEIERLKKHAEESAGLDDLERQFQEAKGRVAELDALAGAALQRSVAESASKRDAIEADRLRALLAEAQVSSLEEIEARLSVPGLDANVLQREVDDLDAAWRTAQREAGQRLADARARRDLAAEAVERSRGMTPGSACSECGQEIRAEYAHLVEQREEAHRKAEAATAEAQRAADAASAAPAALAQLTERLAAGRVAAATSQARAEELRKAFAELAALETKNAQQGSAAPVPHYRPEEHAQAKTRLQSLEEKHERYLALKGAKEQYGATLQKFAATQEAFQKLKEASDALKAEQAKCGFGSAVEAEEALAALRALDVTLGRLEGEAMGHETLVAGAQREWVAAKKRLADLEEQLVRIKQLRVDQVHFEAVTREMLNLREGLNQQIRPDLESRASDNLQALSGGRYTTLELDDQFEATVLDDGVQKAVISGGEEDIVALSLRLALSELIQERQGTPLCLLVLDEVFGSLDGERRQHVMERLAGLKGRFEQILVISHIEEINQVADQCIYLHRDERSKSTYVSDAPLVEAPVLML